MVDESAEIPVRHDRKRSSVIERVRGRLALFWQRVGPESVYRENLHTLQEMHDAMGPGKAQEVFTFLEGPMKAIAMTAGVATTAVDVTLGTLAHSFFRELTGIFVVGAGVLGGLPGVLIGSQTATNAGMRVGIAAGEAVRTISGATVGVGVAELGVAHRAMNIAQRATRPINVRVAETLGRITRGWDAPSPTPTT